jgi:hypothetical protein
MDNLKIDYQIVELAKSSQNALKSVQKDEELYTFLNNSFYEGSDILKDETKHLISLVFCNDKDTYLNGFIDFVTSDAQDIIEKNGFIKI